MRVMGYGTVEVNSRTQETHKDKLVQIVGRWDWRHINLEPVFGVAGF